MKIFHVLLAILGLIGASSSGMAKTVITNLVVNNSIERGGTGDTYVIQQGGLVSGALQYVDRSYSIGSSSSSAVDGQTYILTALGDSHVDEGGSNFMSFKVGQSSTVYVGVDTRVSVRPTWLTANFLDTNTSFVSDGVKFEWFVNMYAAAATVTLGGNTSSSVDSAARMYSVVVVPTLSDARAPSAPGSLTAVCSNALVVGLKWKASTDNTAIAGYRISRGGKVVGTVSPAQTSFNDRSVAPFSNYTYVVSAFDEAGNSTSSKALPASTPAMAADGDAPYCPSTKIATATFDFADAYSEPHTGNAEDQPPYSGGSDLWPLAWGSDGNVYAHFGDGWGLCGELDVDGDNDAMQADKTSFGFSEITGTWPPGSHCPSQFMEGNIYGGYKSSHPSDGGNDGLVNGKATAVEAVGSDFYATAGLYRSGECIGSCPSGAPNHLEIASSSGNGYSWRDNAAWDFCNLSGDNVVGGTFNVCPVGFAHFGKGYSGGPDSNVYMYAIDAATFWGQASLFGANTYLIRAPSDQLLNSDAYQCFGGLDYRGNAIWTTDKNRRQPIFVDNNPNRSGPVSGGTYSFPMAMQLGEAIYDSQIERYIATAQGVKIGQAAVYEAPNPWGPWSEVYYSNINPGSGGTGGWGNLGFGTYNTSTKTFDNADTLGIRTTNAWNSPDGLSTWMVFSSNGLAPASSTFQDLAGNWMDSFNSVELIFTLYQ